ncbi:MAG: glutamine-hydrolyzing carbamoyl-phosphate synthase small subunit [Candidatus Altiarchaeota archaeon]
MKKDKAALVLADGTAVIGEGFGSDGKSKGELVFNTSMSGYQEALTDPSYKYQILMPTYPLIGNYGTIEGQMESDKVQVEGFVVRELTDQPSHGKLTKNLDEFLKDYDIPGLQGVDTRFLTRKIRNYGVMNAILQSPFDEKELEELKEEAASMKSISEVDLVDLVSVKKPIRYDVKGAKKNVVLIDCGEKQSIIKCINDRGVNVVRMPARATKDEILGYEPDGVLVSNGPGDPERVDYVIKTIKEVIEERVPMFGICFGNQLVSLACGAKTYKLKFGHRGANQPVKDLKTNKVYITSQNHGFAVDAETCAGTGLEVTHINLNDQSVEGVKHNDYPVRTVQYHPEAHPGPWDSYYLFDEFLASL